MPSANKTVSVDGPTVSTVWSTVFKTPAFCLDAKHYQEEFTEAQARVDGCGYKSVPLSSHAKAFVSNRATLVTTRSSKAGAPYLRAHDAFNTRPDSSRYVAKNRLRQYDSYLLKEGMLLTPSSGRNLGPITYVGKKLAQFAMTDIVRVIPKDTAVGFYLLAYLLTPTGQALVRRGRTGTTVDHLAPRDVEAVQVVWLPDEVREATAKQMQKAETLLDEARLGLDAVDAELHAIAGLQLPIPEGDYLKSNGASGFSLWSSDMTLRLDPAFYSPTVRACREALTKAGAATLASMADLRQLGRYKRYYVRKGFGRPILSGRQLGQLRPVNLQYISDRSFRRPDDFVLKTGWSLFTCDGRSEEALGTPAYVHSGWNGWLASNHVMRAIPKDDIRPGYLYAALRSPYTQIQLKSRATGSVVDALDPGVIGDVLLPRVGKQDRDILGKRAEDAWEKIATAIKLEDEAVNRIETMIRSAYEAGSATKAVKALS